MKTLKNLSDSVLAGIVGGDLPVKPPHGIPDLPPAPLAAIFTVLAAIAGTPAEDHNPFAVNA